MRIKRNRDKKITGTELRECWNLIRPWWVSEEKWVARGLFLLVFALDMGIVAIGAWLSYWNKNFFNAFADYNISEVWRLMLQALLIAACGIVAEASRTWFYQTLQIRWRRWVTEVYMKGWLEKAAFHRIESNHEIDNADQRISEDLKQMVDLSLNLSLGFFANLCKLVTYSMIIWSMSGTLSFVFLGLNISIPGYMLWFSVIYAFVASVVMEKWGRKMVAVEYEQQLRESDFRFMMMRIRENSAQIAISRGEESERSMLKKLFSRIENNWEYIKLYTRRITVVEKGYTEMGILLAYLLIIPRYFAHKITLGSIMQLTMSFTNVRVGFAWFVFQYKRLTSLRSMCRRLSELYNCINADYENSINFDENTEGVIRVRNLTMALADGSIISKVDSLDISRGSRWLIKGKSGAGKTTFLKALAGIWQFGKGYISLPEARMMFLPQESYLPLGNLRTALCYPYSPETYSSDECRKAMEKCCLGQYVEMIDDEDESWHRKLSPGEKQRLAFARCLLIKPDFLFLDEATSAMDPDLEEKTFLVLLNELQKTAIISVAHRQSMEKYHNNVLNIANS